MMRAPASRTALVAGYYASRLGAGVGWFLAATRYIYAVNGHGDFALSKAELEF
jgi:hypothetical protein